MERVSPAKPPSTLYIAILTDLILLSAETVLIVVCGCIPTLKPIYDKFLKPRRSLKGWYTFYRHRGFFGSQSSTPSKIHNQNQPIGYENLERPVLAYVAHSNKAQSPMEVGLWSSGGNEMESVPVDSMNADRGWTMTYGSRP